MRNIREAIERKLKNLPGDDIIFFIVGELSTEDKKWLSKKGWIYKRVYPCILKPCSIAAGVYAFTKEKDIVLDNNTIPDLVIYACRENKAAHKKRRKKKATQ